MTEVDRVDREAIQDEEEEDMATTEATHQPGSDCTIFLGYTK